MSDKKAWGDREAGTGLVTSPASRPQRADPKVKEFGMAKRLTRRIAEYESLEINVWVTSTAPPDLHPDSLLRHLDRLNRQVDMFIARTDPTPYHAKFVPTGETPKAPEKGGFTTAADIAKRTSGPAKTGSTTFMLKPETPDEAKALKGWGATEEGDGPTMLLTISDAKAPEFEKWFNSQGLTYERVNRIDYTNKK